MDRVEPKLLLNFQRPIGQHWKGKINNAGVSAPFITGKVFKYPELLVPATVDDTGMNLTALANTIYIMAREHNMSLSSYGHLDPVKFVVAALYVALMIEEVRRDLSCIGKYQFGNRTLGDLISTALTGTTISGNITLLPQLILRFNFVVNRLNALYIPAIKILEDWLPHRTCVYKDDEGDRFQYYFYAMANYYELDVNASSTTVGQLLFQAIDLSNSSGINQKLSMIESLLAKYEADDDFVNFAVEATKAGLPALKLNPIATDGSSIKLPEFIEKFDIDDVCSLENAYFVTPVYETSPIIFINRKFTWDIKENTTTGKFEVGVWSYYDSGTSTYTRYVDRLPVLHPGYTLGGTSVDYTNHGDPVSIRPLFTHAQINSEYGLKTFSRYIAAVSDDATAISGLIVTKDLCGVPSPVGNISNKACVYLTTHSHMMLGIPRIYFKSSPTSSVSQYGASNYIGGMYTMQATLDYFDNMFLGFKARTYTVCVGSWSTMSLTPIYHDFDYIVMLNDDNINLFNAAQIWNGFTLISGSTNSGSKQKPKFKK